MFRLDFARAAGALLILVAGASGGNSVHADQGDVEHDRPATQLRGAALVAEDFTGFAGAGFDTPPSAGQLDSALWRVTGLSDGDSVFDGTADSGDFARGTSTGGTNTGGIYGFETPGGNVLLGAQPAGSDFTPGSFDLRIQNSSAQAINALEVSYRIGVYNDQNRANSLDFAWSVDDVTYTDVPELDFTTPEASDSSPAWVFTDRSIILTGFVIEPGEFIFLRWKSEEVSGGGARDEFGIDDVVIATTAPPELLFDADGPVDALAGQALTYSISVTNPSETLALENLVVTDILPAGLSYSSDTAAVTPTVTASSIEWDFGTLAAGDSVAFDLTLDSDAAITPNTTLTNTIDVDASREGQPINDQATQDTTFRALVTIPDIQQVADPATDDASPLVGEVVFVDGVITAAPGELFGTDTLVVQTTSGGPWSGLVLVGDFSDQTIVRGDALRALGTVEEDRGLTRLATDLIEVTGQETVPAPESLMTSGFGEQDAAASEQWESVLVEFSNVDVTAVLGFGEWQFDDGSGIARGDDGGSSTLSPAVGDSYGFLRGIGWFSFGDYKLQPRDNADFDFQPDVFEIAEIQGEGLRSPFAPASGNGAGDVVRTEDNIVTAVGANGFFIQMPDDRPSDDLPLASRGLFVFTSSTPSVAVGERVNVDGAVAEFFDFTQIAQPDAVEIIGSGASLPVPVLFDAQTPSPDPQSPSCGINNFECFEGMRVAVANGLVTAPSQSFGSDPVAEAWISTDGERILRGKGAEFPGVPGCATCPVWSGAPELLEIDPDRFGLFTEPLAAGTPLSATGVIGFSFGDYGLWPTELDIGIEPELPRPVAVADAPMLTVGSLNALNLFDDTLGPTRPITVCGGGREATDRLVLSPTEYATKLNKLAVYVTQGLRAPDILAVQEVESADVLDDLADEIVVLGGLQYTAYLEPANDIGNISNGYLVNESRVSVDSIELQAEAECLSSDGSPLHDRPPLVLRGTFTSGSASLEFAVLNNHLRSLGSIGTSTRTRLKRQEQAQSIATLVQDLQVAEPELPILLVGDYNAFQFSDGFVDVIGHLLGTADPTENLVSQENAGQPGFDDSNIPDPVLVNLLDRAAESERYSFIFQAVSQVLDHALVTQSAAPLVSGFGYSRANADYSEAFESDVTTVARASDHDGYVLMLDSDRIFSDGFE